MTESPLDWAEAQDEADDSDGRRRQLMILGGVAGVAVLVGGGFLLLHGSGSSSSDNGAIAPPVHHAPVAAPAVAPVSAVPVFHGAVGHDPFDPPERILEALAPAAPPAATTASSVKVPVSGGGSILVPTGTGTTPAQTDTTGTGAGSVATTPIQWIQLLAVHNVGGHWLVDVRTENGTFRDVKAGSQKIGGTFFSFLGEDGALSKPSFVFVVGDNAGGNLVPNANVAPFTGTLHASQLNSTLVLRFGRVDGGAS